MPEESFFNESSDPAKLNNRQRGQLAELAFMRKAATLGLSIAKPWNEGERYDFIARIENVCWRVQVKSVSAKAAFRHLRSSRIEKVLLRAIPRSLEINETDTFRNRNGNESSVSRNMKNAAQYGSHFRRYTAHTPDPCLPREKVGFFFRDYAVDARSGVQSGSCASSSAS